MKAGVNEVLWCMALRSDKETSSQENTVDGSGFGEHVSPRVGQYDEAAIAAVRDAHALGEVAHGGRRFRMHRNAGGNRRSRPRDDDRFHVSARASRHEVLRDSLNRVGIQRA